VTRRHLLLIHRWLGLALALWFILLGLTGSILVFQFEIDRWLNPALLRDDRRGGPVGPETAIATARTHFPAAAVERVRMPAAAGDVYRLLLREQGSRRIGSPRIEAMVSPVTGELLGTRPAESYGVDAPRLVRTAYDLHHKLLLGNSGKTAVGTVGVLLLVMLALGGVLATANAGRLGAKGLLGIRWSASGTRVVYDAHRSTGLIAGVLLLVSTVTGFTLAFPDYAREVVGLFSKVVAFPAVPWTGRGPDGPRPGLAEVRERTVGAYPGHAITEIHMPLRPNAGYLFYLRGERDVHRLGDTLAWVHPGTATVLLERSTRTRSAGEHLLHWLMPLHSGFAFGLAGRVAMCVAGFVPLVMGATGFLLWLRKRRSAAVADRRREARRSNAGRTD
jgi:uncharacterized iron-regulated membrane protein